MQFHLTLTRCHLQHRKSILYPHINPPCLHVIVLWPLLMAKPPGVWSPPTVVLLSCETTGKNSALIGGSCEMPLNVAI